MQDLYVDEALANSILGNISTISNTINEIKNAINSEIMTKIGTDGVWTGEAAENAKLSFGECVAVIESLSEDVKHASAAIQRSVETLKAVNQAAAGK